MVEAITSELDSQPASAPARIPMGTILGELADAMDSTKKSLDRYKQVTVLQPLRDLKENELPKWTQDELDSLKRVAEAKEKERLWSYGHLVSSIGYASLSVVFGLYLLSTGEERGERFVYIGTALLVNTLMDYFGGWTAVSKLVSFGHESVEQNLRITLPIISTLTTFFFVPHNLTGLSIDHKTLFENIDKLMSGINMVVQVASAYTKFVKGQAERHLMDIQGKISLTLMKIEPLTIRNENLTNSAKQVNDAMKGGIKKIIKGTSAIPMEAV